jgi:hypothetical protein
LSYWVDARQVLRSPSTAENAFVEIPRENVLEATLPTALFESAGVQTQPYIDDIEVVVDTMLDRITSSVFFPLSFLEIFCAGLTNICRSIYFGTDVAVAVVESNLAVQRSQFGLSMGQTSMNSSSNT